MRYGVLPYRKFLIWTHPARRAGFRATAPMVNGRVTPHSQKPARNVTSANMTALKMKAAPLFLALGLGLASAVVVTGITGCASGPFSSNLNQSPPDSKSAQGGDDHAQPVYTSPTVTPATNNLANSPSD